MERLRHLPGPNHCKLASYSELLRKKHKKEDGFYRIRGRIAFETKSHRGNVEMRDETKECRFIGGVELS